MTATAARKHPARSVVLLLALVLVLCGIGWMAFARDEVQIGDRFDDRSVMNDGRSRQLNLQLPVAQLNLRVVSGDTAGAYDDEVKAPDGAAMVQVTWTPTRIGVPPVWPGASPHQRRDPGAELLLITGGHSYRLASGLRANDVGSAAVVVVKGDASDTRIEARYAGRTMRAASGTADIVNPSPSARCTDPSERRHPGRVFLNVDCALPVHRSVYVPGLGAAPAGTEWLVLYAAGVSRSERDATVYPSGSDATGARYVSTGAPTVTVRADGVTAEPRSAGKDIVDGDSVRLAARAWLVPEGEASTVHLRYRLHMSLDRQRTEIAGQPDRHDIDLRCVATYPAR